MDNNSIIRKCAVDMERAAGDLIRRSDPVIRRTLALSVQRKAKVIIDLCDGKAVEGVTDAPDDTKAAEAPAHATDPVNTEEQPRSPAVAETVAAIARPARGAFAQPQAEAKE